MYFSYMIICLNVSYNVRYFTCEMKYGLFAPSSKVTKSKKQVLPSKKPANSPGPSLDTAAKLMFNKAALVNSDISPFVAPPPGSPGEKATRRNNVSSKEAGGCKCG